uniref:Uncharacterized protein n=1 Tax=Solanum tuberosum TaxID=4113 RepID=M1DU51_SOLTU
MIDLKALYTSGESSMTIDEIVDAILSKKSGYIKGLGYGPKLTTELEDSFRKTKEEASSVQLGLQKRLDAAEVVVENQQSQIEILTSQLDTLSARQDDIMKQLQHFMSLSRSSYTLKLDKRYIILVFLRGVFNSLKERKIGEVIYYLEDPNCVDQQFEKLECVELREFEGTIFELIFLRQILAYSPSLSRIIVEPSNDLDVADVLDLYEELMMSLKASPRIKVIVAPHGQDA